MAVAVDAQLTKAQFLGLAASLLEVGHAAGITGRGEGAFRRHDHDGDVLQILEFTGGLGLQLVGADALFGRRHVHQLELGDIVHRRIVGHRDGRHAPNIGPHKGLPAAFDRDDALHQIRPDLGHQPTKGSAGGMGHDHRRTDLVEQHGSALAPHRMRDDGRGWVEAGRRAGRSGRDHIRTALGGDELVEVLRSNRAFAHPLIVEMLERERFGGSRRIGRREAPRDVFERSGDGRESPVEQRMERRAPVTGAIDDIDAVAFLRQISGPAGTPVGGAHPVEALAAAAVYEHDRVGMLHFAGNPGLHIHLLATDVGAAGEIGALDAHPEVAPLGQIERDFRGRRGASRILRGELTGLGQHGGHSETAGGGCGEVAPRETARLLGMFLVGMLLGHFRHESSLSFNHSARRNPLS